MSSTCAAVAKFGFRIRTRSGAIVDHLMILGCDASDAERKLRQIYVGCEILESRCFPVRNRGAMRGNDASYEEVMDLIASSGESGVRTGRSG